jgi:hemerythrin superfamily protein
MDAITLLKDDHKTVEALFKRFERAGDDAHGVKREIVDKIIEELSIHAAVEEQLFYPATRATVPAVEDVALESLEEHHIVKWVLSELEKMDPADERFDAKVTVLMENVRHHVEEEEDDYFPKVRDELGRNALNDLGDAMENAKRTAPTHPHPRSPDTPPGNLVVGTAAGVVDRVGDTAAGVVDRVGDTVSGVAQTGVSTLSDLIARLTDTKRPTTSKPRKANKPRKASKASRASKTTRSASRGVAKTAKAAKSGAKATATSARKAGKRTTTTAKRAATSARRGTGTPRSGVKATATSARKGAKRTTTTAKRAATTTGRTAKKAAGSTRTTTKRAAKTTKKPSR